MIFESRIDRKNKGKEREKKETPKGETEINCPLRGKNRLS